MENYTFVPFGSMCMVAMFLRDNYFRNKSLPFDWTVQNLKAIINVVDNNFEDFLNPQYLSKPYEKYPHIVYNSKYNLYFYHQFKSGDIKEQLPRVEQYFESKIKNLYNYFSSSDKKIFIHYCLNKDDIPYIRDNVDFIKNWFKDKNAELWLIMNSDFEYKDLKEHFKIFDAKTDSIFEVTQQPIVFKDIINNIPGFYDEINNHFDHNQWKINKKRAHKLKRQTFIYKVKRKLGLVKTA